MSRPPSRLGRFLQCSFFFAGDFWGGLFGAAFLLRGRFATEFLPGSFVFEFYLDVLLPSFAWIFWCDLFHPADHAFFFKRPTHVFQVAQE